MKRALSLLSCVAIVGALIVLSTSRPAKAFPEFRKEFIAKYVKQDAGDAKEMEFAQICEKAKCNICHEGKNKKNRNVYGKQLARLLTEDDKENKAKIQESLEKVSAMKSKADDTSAPTFGELIKAGKLPCGDLK